MSGKSYSSAPIPVVILFWFCVYCGYHYYRYETLPFNLGSHIAKFMGPSEPAAPRPVVSISVHELFNVYSENEVAADERFKGKDLIASGRVASINKGGFGGIYLTVETPNRFMHANMNIHSDDASKASALRKGQVVEARCRSVQLILGAPSLGDCRILSFR